VCRQALDLTAKSRCQAFVVPQERGCPRLADLALKRQEFLLDPAVSTPPGLLRRREGDCQLRPRLLAGLGHGLNHRGIIHHREQLSAIGFGSGG
jgi:hypothetical protein